MKEIWKPVGGYEGLYEVSNLGRVRSLSRKVIVHHADSTTHIKTLSMRLLKPCLDIGGYRRVSLWKNSQWEKPRISWLVLEAFKGTRPKGMDSCHNDGSRTNDCIANLRWDTRRGNFKDKILHGTHHRGERCPTAKLKESQVRQIMKLMNSKKYYQREIAERFNVTRETISAIVCGKRWSYLNADG